MVWMKSLGWEEVLVAWMKTLEAGGGAVGMDEELGDGRTCCWHG